MGRLEITFGRLRLERPGMVASGIMDETGDSMARMIRSGAGAVVRVGSAAVVVRATGAAVCSVGLASWASAGVTKAATHNARVAME